MPSPSSQIKLKKYVYPREALYAEGIFNFFHSLRFFYLLFFQLNLDFDQNEAKLKFLQFNCLSIAKIIFF
jgi:hypothetical protein